MTDLGRLLDLLPGLAWTALADGRAEHLNKEWLDYTGLTLGAAKGEGWLAAVHPDDRAELAAEWARVIGSGRAGEARARLRRSDGEFRWFEFVANPDRGPDGTIRRWCGTNVDIHDRIRAEIAEASLSRTNQHLTEAQRLSRTGSFTWDVLADEHIWSEEIYRIFDFPLSSKVTVDLLRQAIHPDDRADVEKLLGGAIDTTSFDLPFRILTGSGDIRHARVVGQRIETIVDRPVFLGALQDVTESRVAEESRKTAEANLLRANHYFKAAQRLSKTGSWTWDPERDELDWSDEIYQIYEIDPRQTPSSDLVFGSNSMIHPDDLQQFETYHLEALKVGESFEHSYRIITPSGAVKNLHSKMERHPDILDRPVFIGATQDVTESTRFEEALSTAVAELGRASRIMAVSAFTASIVHEVSQPLAGIVTNASTCLRALASDRPKTEIARTTVQRISRDAGRASELIHRMRELFVRKPVCMEPTDLNDLIEEVLTLSQRELRGKGISVDTRFARSLPPVNGDRVQLQQVILNLILNAADALSDLVERPRELAVETSMGDGAVVAAIIDDGVGLDPEGTEQIFEPFHSTKPNGMGIGLFISRSIVRSHGGQIRASNNEDFGATFTVSIPAIVQSPP